MRKELEFSAKFDHTEFNRSIEQIQRKLKEVTSAIGIGQMQQRTSQRLQQMGMTGIVSAPTREAFEKSTQTSRREMDQAIAEQARGQEKLGKIIAQRTELLKKLQKQQQEMVKGSQEELAIKEKIARVEENNQRLRDTYRQRDAALNQAMDVREQMRPQGFDRLRQAYQGGGIGGAITAAGRMGMFSPGNIAGVLGAAGAGAGFVGNILGATAGVPMRVEAAKGTAIQSTIGQDLSRIYAGKSPFEAAFLPEREKAAGIAKEKSEQERKADLFKSFGTMVEGAISGAIKGGAAGAGVGAFGGLPGAAIGGVGGAIIGGIGGGVSAIAANDRQRERLLSFLPGEMGEKHQRQYDQLLAAQRAKDFRETLESLKAQDPAKKAVIENFEQNYLKNLEVQRTLGISNAQFYGQGGLLQRGAAAGFLPEQAMGMAQSIVGAGGSARMGRQAEFGLQMQRAGITNAPQLLGTLSGTIQNPEANKRAVISIMSEAFQIGLDNTDFAEENRRFSQAAATIIARTGATGEGDQARAAQNLGLFMADRTNVGVQAAQTAYERAQERGSALSGRRGALRMTEALQDPALSKIPTGELTELLNLRPEQLTRDNEMVQYFASQAGISPDELLEKLEGGRKSSRFLIPGSKQKVTGFTEQISRFMKENQIDRAEFERRRVAGELPPEITQALGGAQVRAMMEEKGQMTTPEIRAMGMEFVPGAPTATKEQREATRRMIEGVGPRLEDRVQAEAAEGADKLRQQFVLLVPELEKMIKATSKFTDTVSGEADELRRKSDVIRSTLPSADPFGTFGSRSVLPASTQQPKPTKVQK